MTDVVMIYMTAADRGEALRIGRALVEGKLAACVNVLGEATSIYRWQGAVEEAGEVVLVAKTKAELFGAVRDKVKSLHSYETPCIVAYPMANADAAYLAWIKSSVA